MYTGCLTELKTLRTTDARMPFLPHSRFSLVAVFRVFFSGVVFTRVIQTHVSLSFLYLMLAFLFFVSLSLCCSLSFGLSSAALSWEGLLIIDVSAPERVCVYQCMSQQVSRRISFCMYVMLCVFCLCDTL